LQVNFGVPTLARAPLLAAPLVVPSAHRAGLAEVPPGVARELVVVVLLLELFLGGLALAWPLVVAPLALVAAVPAGRVAPAGAAVLVLALGLLLRARARRLDPAVALAGAAAGRRVAVAALLAAVTGC